MGSTSHNELYLKSLLKQPELLSTHNDYVNSLAYPLLQAQPSGMLRMTWKNLKTTSRLLADFNYAGKQHAHTMLLKNITYYEKRTPCDDTFNVILTKHYEDNYDCNRI